MAAPLTGSSREKPEEGCGSLGSAQVCEEGCCASEEPSCEEGCEDACADGSSSGASAVICSCCDWVEGELSPSDCALGVSAAGCFFAGSYGCSCFSCGYRSWFYALDGLVHCDPGSSACTGKAHRQSKVEALAGDKFLKTVTHGDHSILS